MGVRPRCKCRGSPQVRGREGEKGAAEEGEEERAVKEVEEPMRVVRGAGRR